MIEKGLTGKSEARVAPANTAKAVGSGSLEVFATPMLAALMENAAINALNLPADQTSVGTYLEVRHIAATPVGMIVWAEARVVEVNERTVVYYIEAYDEKEKIGEAKHERVIVHIEKFMAKAQGKLK
jgi:fluoroacetyl-CoA thioesterase